MLKPLDNHILIEPEKEKTEGSIVLAKTKEELPEIGKIIEVGSGVKDLVIGNKVLFKKYGAYEVEDNYLIVSREDILGLYEA